MFEDPKLQNPQMWRFHALLRSSLMDASKKWCVLRPKWSKNFFLFNEYIHLQFEIKHHGWFLCYNFCRLQNNLTMVAVCYKNICKRIFGTSIVSIFLFSSLSQIVKIWQFLIFICQIMWLYLRHWYGMFLLMELMASHMRLIYLDQFDILTDSMG